MNIEFSLNWHNIKMIKAAKIVKKILPFFKAMECRSILDYGAGTLRHSRYFMDHGFQVYIVETLECLEVLHRESPFRDLAGHYDLETIKFFDLKVDAAIANFVLNIIRDPWQRQVAVKNVHKSLKRDGYFLVEVRPQAFSANELDRLIIPLGFVKVSKFDQEKSQAALYRKI